MDLIPELGWHSSVKMKGVPRFLRSVLSTKQLPARYSHGNYFASLHHYSGGLTASLWAAVENSPSLKGKSTDFLYTVAKCKALLFCNDHHFFTLSCCTKLVHLHTLQLHVGNIRGYIFLSTSVKLECTDAMGLVVPVPAWEEQRVLSWP